MASIYIPDLVGAQLTYDLWTWRGSGGVSLCRGRGRHGVGVGLLPSRLRGLHRRGGCSVDLRIRQIEEKDEITNDKKSFSVISNSSEAEKDRDITNYQYIAKDRIYAKNGAKYKLLTQLMRRFD